MTGVYQIKSNGGVKICNLKGESESQSQSGINVALLLSSFLPTYRPPNRE